jgi:hypothetical protein
MDKAFENRPSALPDRLVPLGFRLSRPDRGGAGGPVSPCGCRSTQGGRRQGLEDLQVGSARPDSNRLRLSDHLRLETFELVAADDALPEQGREFTELIRH